jgi:AraC family transcriptional regulator
MNSVNYQPRDSHNLGAARAVNHEWSGIRVQSIHIDALSGRSWHRLDGDQPILSVVVNEVGGLCDARPALHVVGARRRSRRFGVGHVSLIPANSSVWGYSESIEQVDEVRLVLGTEGVKAVLGDEFDSTSLQHARLALNDDSLQALGRLLCGYEATDRSSALFGDSVVAAMIARVSNLNPGSNPNRRGLGLTTRQLRAVSDLIQDNLARQIRLSELAVVTGLSPSQFGRAFKTSTGTTPHQWHLSARIERAKRMLVDRRAALVDIALETGFSEQSHFTRAFRGATGVSPGAWRRRATL